MIHRKTTNAEESGFLFHCRSDFGPCKISARVFLALLALIALLNPLAGQGVPEGQKRRAIQPAYILHGATLEKLRSAPLFPQSTITAANDIRASEQSSQPDDGVQSVSDRVLVAFRNGISADEKQAILAQASGNLQLASNPGSPFFDVVQVTNGGVALTDVIAQLRSDPRVRIAEPDYIVHTQNTIPNDPYFPYLWGLRNIGQGDYGSHYMHYMFNGGSRYLGNQGLGSDHRQQPGDSRRDRHRCGLHPSRSRAQYIARQLQ